MGEMNLRGTGILEHGNLCTGDMIVTLFSRIEIQFENRSDLKS